MIPVMTSTQTDKSAMDLAGVEAGEKIFVPCGDGPFGSVAQTAMADQNGRTVVCARHRKVEDFICNIDISLLLFFTFEMRADFAISPYFHCKPRATVLIPAFDLMKSTRATKEKDSDLLQRNRDEDQHLRTPEYPLRRLAGAEPAGVIPVPRASSVIWVVTQSWAPGSAPSGGSVVCDRAFHGSGIAWNQGLAHRVT
jgi:hypothetical protein